VEVATRLGRLSLVVRAASNEDTPAIVKAGDKIGITWASDVSPALGAETTASVPNIVHVYRGAADGQEYHF
jgi:hypothetical protein